MQRVCSEPLSADFLHHYGALHVLFWQLGVESRDFSQAERERTACKADQIHKMITVFTQDGPRLSF